MNRSSQYLSVIIMSVLTLGLLSCVGKKETIVVEETGMYFEVPHILFLTCSVTIIGDKVELKVEDKILTKGKLKGAHMDITSPKIGDWVVSIVDVDLNVIATTRLDNPLLYRAEYVNDAGVLETKLIERESGVLSVRMPIEGDAHQVIIKRKTLDGFDSIFQMKTTEL